MSTNDYQPTLADYLAILRRRSALIIGSFVAIFAVATAVALAVPPVYESTGTILIESQQIPTELVQAPVTSYADERIEIIKQRVMTRENLLRIIAKHGLFQAGGTAVTPSEQVDEIRKSTQVELITANIRTGARGTGTIAFKVSFEHRRPETAQAVANELVTLFLNENVKVRTERATQTTEFLKQESDRLRSELDKLEGQVASYKQQHGSALPDNTLVAVAAMQRVESDLRTVERDYRAAEEELRYLDVEHAAALAGATAVAGGGVAGPPTVAGDLQRSRAELARLQAVYTDDHPDVRSMKRRIEGLEQALAADKAEKAGGAAGGTKDLAVTRIESRMAGVRSRMSGMSAQQASLRAKLGQMEREMQAAPQVERGLAALTRDYQTTQRKYDETRAKLETAQMAENLEGEQKAERFALLEPPALPEKPIKPDRKKMIALGGVMAAAGSAGLAGMAESLLGTVRGLEAISSALGQRPLVNIPYIPVAAEAGQRRRNYMLAGIGLAIVILLALAATHFLYMPLDVVVSKLLIRLG
jgi:polysaccharide chain length determinant protein (PEP-CTERM system associated)